MTRKVAAAEQAATDEPTPRGAGNYTQARFMVTGRQSMTVIANDPSGVAVRKQIAFVSLVPVDDAGEPIGDGVGSLGVAGIGGSGGAGGPIPGEFRVRIPSIELMSTIQDGAILGFTVLG